MQQSKESVYGVVCLALLGLAGCSAPRDFDLEKAVSATPLDIPKMPEVSEGIHQEPGHQVIVDRLARAERILKSFEQDALERRDTLVTGALDTTAAIGHDTIYPELNKAREELLAALVNPASNLTARQFETLEDALVSLRVVGGLLNAGQIGRRAISGGGDSRVAFDGNMNPLYEALAKVELARFFMSADLP